MDCVRERLPGTTNAVPYMAVQNRFPGIGTGSSDRAGISERPGFNLLDRYPEGGSSSSTPCLDDRNHAALTDLLHGLGIDAVAHGFRSSFRNWAAECTDAPREVCELALAHVNSDRVEAAYRRVLVRR